MLLFFSFFFFFNDTATTEIYTLSLHDALPIFPRSASGARLFSWRRHSKMERRKDRKSTRLNSSHLVNSYAVFCLKKKTQKCCAGIHRQTRCARGLNHTDKHAH